jgi:hypothetical protein
LLSEAEENETRLPRPPGSFKLALPHSLLLRVCYLV